MASSKAATGPAVYGTPEQLAMLLASVADLAEREPDETFTDATVRTAARSLAATLHTRLAGTPAPDGQPRATSFGLAQ